MNSPRTPVKTRSQKQQQGFRDLSQTIKAKKRLDMQGNDAQTIGEGATRKLTGNTGAGEDGATSLLSMEERIAVQMEDALSRVAETMAKMEFTFQEKMYNENGIWKREMERLIRENNNNTAKANQPNTAEPKATTAAQHNTTTTATCTDERPMNPLLLTPPTHRPSMITEQEAHTDHTRRYAAEQASLEDEYHTTRILEPRRDLMRTQLRMPRSQNIQSDRWGISFEGDDEKVPVDEFIFRVEHLQQLHDVPWSTIMGDFHKILRGKAQDWYWLHLRTRGSQPWHTFKATMIKQFKTHKSDFDIMKQLVERKQRHNEEVEDYIHQMRKLHTRLTSPMAEKELIHIIKGNMNEEVARILYSMDIRTLPELCKEYHRAQRIFVRRRSFQPPVNNYQRPSRPVVTEILADEVELPNEGDEGLTAAIDEIRSNHQNVGTARR